MDSMIDEQTALDKIIQEAQQREDEVPATGRMGEGGTGWFSLGSEKKAVGVCVGVSGSG